MHRLQALYHSLKTPSSEDFADCRGEGKRTRLSLCMMRAALVSRSSKWYYCSMDRAKKSEDKSELEKGQLLICTV